MLCRFEQQLADPSVTWSLPADFEVVYENVGDDVVVGGVFLSLLIKQPGWVFRKPKEFLVGAMEKYLKILTKQDHSAKDGRQLETITEALVKVGLSTCVLEVVQSAVCSLARAVRWLVRLISNESAWVCLI